MKAKLVITLSAMSVIGGSVWFITRAGHHGISPSVGSLSNTGFSSVAEVENVAKTEGKPAAEDESEFLRATTRTNESFESELRSFSTKELRKELQSITAVLEPIFKLSNQQALSTSQRVTVANGLRKRQALLKILIDRQLEQTQRRIRQ